MVMIESNRALDAESSDASAPSGGSGKGDGPGADGESASSGSSASAAPKKIQSSRFKDAIRKVMGSHKRMPSLMLVTQQLIQQRTKMMAAKFFHANPL